MEGKGTYINVILEKKEGIEIIILFYLSFNCSPHFFSD